MDKETKEKVEQIGRDIRARLNTHFKQWNGGLPYRAIMSSQTYRAKAVGMLLGELSDTLEDQGFIKVVSTPSGARFVFAGDCGLTEDQMRDWLQEQEMVKEASKEARRASKAANE